MAGAGLQKAGTTPAGIGTPSAAPILSGPGSGALLQDPTTGLAAQGRIIDPVSGQYIFNSYGRTSGTTEVRQLVMLAAKTVLGTAAMTTLGNSLSDVKMIGPNFQKLVSDKLRVAFAPIVARGLMKIVAIDVQQQADPKTRAYAFVRWVDTTTGLEEATQL